MVAKEKKNRKKPARKKPRKLKFYGKREHVRPEDRKIAEVQGPFECYLLKSTNPAYFKTTYTGASGVSVRKRLDKFHNKDKVKRSRGYGPWELVCVVSGFRTWSEALQFETRWHMECNGCTRWSQGVDATLRAMHRTMAREKWTSNSPPSKDVPLVVTMEGEEGEAAASP